MSRIFSNFMRQTPREKSTEFERAGIYTSLNCIPLLTDAGPCDAENLGRICQQIYSATEAMLTVFTSQKQRLQRVTAERDRLSEEMLQLKVAIKAKAFSGEKQDSVDSNPPNLKDQLVGHEHLRQQMEMIAQKRAEAMRESNKQRSLLEKEELKLQEEQKRIAEEYEKLRKTRNLIEEDRLTLQKCYEQYRGMKVKVDEPLKTIVVAEDLIEDRRDTSTSRRSTYSANPNSFNHQNRLSSPSLQNSIKDLPIRKPTNPSNPMPDEAPPSAHHGHLPVHLAKSSSKKYQFRR